MCLSTHHLAIPAASDRNRLYLPAPRTPEGARSAGHTPALIGLELFTFQRTRGPRRPCETGDSTASRRSVNTPDSFFLLSENSGGMDGSRSPKAVIPDTSPQSAAKYTSAPEGRQDESFRNSAAPPQRAQTPAIRAFARPRAEKSLAPRRRRRQDSLRKTQGGSQRGRPARLAAESARRGP